MIYEPLDAFVSDDDELTFDEPVPFPTENPSNVVCLSAQANRGLVRGINVDLSS
jgi:hypothetical protein